MDTAQTQDSMGTACARLGSCKTGYGLQTLLADSILIFYSGLNIPLVLTCFYHNGLSAFRLC